LNPKHDLLGVLGDEFALVAGTVAQVQNVGFDRRSESGQN
jgi:hypothetical protein